MAPSTSPISFPRTEPADPWALSALDGFYRAHARIYDWTRPFILFGRRQAIRALSLRPGDRVLDVGCGTGWGLPRLCALGAEPVGIECSAPMRREAARRLARRGLSDAVVLDPSPYGSHERHACSVDAILFSYSLSMIPPFDTVLERAERDLRKGGRIVALDFLDARGAVGVALRRSHVHLGSERLEALCRRFPSHLVTVRSVGLWRFYLFTAWL